MARAHDVAVTGSLGVLVRGVVGGRLDAETADRRLATWRTEYGYRSPVRSVTEFLPE